jgi:hypothetical protein
VKSLMSRDSKTGNTNFYESVGNLPGTVHRRAPYPDWVGFAQRESCSPSGRYKDSSTVAALFASGILGSPVQPQMEKLKFMKTAIAAWLLAATFASGALAQERLSKEAIEKRGFTFIDEKPVLVPGIPGTSTPHTIYEWHFSLGDMHGLPREIYVLENPTDDDFALIDEACIQEYWAIYEYLKKKTGKTEF